MAKKSYVAESRLSHDGVDVLPGETIEMEASRAVSLLEAGVLIEISAADKRKKDKEAAEAAALAAATAQAEAAAAAQQVIDDDAAAALAASTGAAGAAPGAESDADTGAAK